MKKKLNELIAKAFCINLYFRQDRWAEASAQFAAEGLNVERFNAIHGKEFKTEYRIKPGNCGCNLSHLQVIQQAKFMGLPAIMVFEDDVVLRKNFVSLIDQILEDLPPEWDLIMLAGTHKKPLSLVTDKLYLANESYCNHAYIVRECLYDLLIMRLQEFNCPLDVIFTEVQLTHHVYVTNPPMAWQSESYSDIEERVMDYPWLKDNKQ